MPDVWGQDIPVIIGPESSSLTSSNETMVVSMSLSRRRRISRLLVRIQSGSSWTFSVVRSLISARVPDLTRCTWRLGASRSRLPMRPLVPLKCVSLVGVVRPTVLDLRSVTLEPSVLGSIIVMGNTLGAQQTPESLPTLLSSLRRGVNSGGQLLAQMLDPLDTEDPRHHEYHERNRRRGLPPGLATIRLRYQDLIDEWINLWMPTDAELRDATEGTGWQLTETRRVGPHRVRLFEARAT